MTINYTLNKEKVLKNLKTTWLGKKLYVFDEVTSTFEKAYEVPKENGTVVCALSQTNGSGRLGRSWKSQKGGIYFSIILNNDLSPERLRLMTVRCALGVHRALLNYTDCKIKWPNDIITSDGKKLCGILTRLQTNTSDSFLNIGIGINANNSDFYPELKYAVSLKSIMKAEVDESEILCGVLENVQTCIEADEEEILKNYAQCCVNIGRRVKAIYAQSGEFFTGEGVGINPDGSLIIKKDDESFISVDSGEVSVRGVYGEDYV